MTNLRKNKQKVTKVIPQKKGFSLDTLAQLGRFEKNHPKKEGITTLKKRSIAKYYTNEILFPMIDYTKGDFPGWNKKFWNSYYCVHRLEQTPEGTVKSKYCKNRWCIVCNRIRTAININGYTPILEKHDDLYFVTLTAPTVEGAVLRDRLDEMQRLFYNSNKVLRKNHKVVGVRKLEITWNWQSNKYHPHYHVIIRGKHQADRLVIEWLKRNKDATEKCQHVSKANKGSLVELFKYASKMYTEDENEPDGIRKYPPEVNMTIFKALSRKRVLQPFGGMKLVDDDFEPEIATVNLDEETGNTSIWLWEHEYKTWVNPETGEARV